MCLRFTQVINKVLVKKKQKKKKMDTECAVCYSEVATCKLVCKHSFCKSCIKTWYQKSEEPTCPMCRHTLYFKGLHKISEKWEDERIEKLNEEAFNTAFEAIFEEGSEYSYSEVDSEYSDESDWETSSENEEGPTTPRSVFEFPRSIPSDTSSEVTSKSLDWQSDGDYLIDSIIKLQAAYQKALKAGIDIPYFLEGDNYLFFSIDNGDTGTFVTFDDVFPHEKNLFVSKHAGMIQNKRTGSRVPPKGDSTFTVVVLVECL
jgi:hypothetical protein